MSETNGSPMLETEGLRSGYHGVNVLKDISFEVGNEVFTVLGANGAGKTTLLATLARLIPSTAGSIKFLGSDVTHIPAFETAAAAWVMCPRKKACSPI